MQNAKTLKKQAEAQRPDAILLDWELPGRDSQELIAILHKLEPRPRVIAMSSKLEKGRVALAAGADAFISKGETPERVADRLRAVAANISAN